jgi:beta-galactosidase
MSRGGFLYADIVDEHGTVFPVSEESVKFAMQGDASLVGENPSKLRAGTAFAVIKTGTHSGVLQIEASMDLGMKNCMKLKVRPSLSP